MSKFEKATFASGCFWCGEAIFEELEGVESVVSGYAGPSTSSGQAPTYEEVSTGKTEYAEAIQITFDPEKISYSDLLEVFWATHDPTHLNRQGPDVGHQYRSLIFYHNDEQKRLAEESKRQLEESGEYKNPVVTEIAAFDKFYPAEQYHQDYYSHNQEAPYCQAVINPKLEKFRKKFKDKLKKLKKAWIVSVDMGYGHQRTAYPLKELAFKGEIITANNYSTIPKKDKKIWESTTDFYNFISKFHEVPLIGKPAFKIFDSFQKIVPFYPKREHSKSNISLKNIYALLKRGWGRHLIEKLKMENSGLPLVATFFIPAFMAEFFEYPGNIFCIVTDTDASRTWAPLEPSASKIKYLAPTDQVAARLELYGVKKENIVLTGYPLPMENIGESHEVAKKDLRTRIPNLDPVGNYRERHSSLIKEHLGDLVEESSRPLTILFAVGGAGAQKKLAVEILKGLKQSIKDNKLKIILSAGVRKEVNELFLKSISRLNLKNELNKNLEIIFTPHLNSSEGFTEDLFEFFRQFNEALRKTDILWTKPSELSFYAGLGLPLIIAPAIGSQEDFNKEWLLKLGVGLPQKNPAYAGQWLFDLLKEGWFAEAAMEGFIEIDKSGVQKISKAILQ